jgi:hypothetical protein
VNDAKKYKHALEAVAKDKEIVAVNNDLNDATITSFDMLLQSHSPDDSVRVEAAFNAIQPHTIAKYYSPQVLPVCRKALSIHMKISAPTGNR